MRRTERTARKMHQCLFCYGRIDPGTRYIDGFWLYEGTEPTPWKAHVDCQALADRHTSFEGVPPFDDDHYWCPSDLPDDDRAELERLLERGRTDLRMPPRG